MTEFGLNGVSHHTMRHTGITLMLEKGRNPRAIQTLAGWTSLRMLERYGHVRDAEILQAVAGNAEHLERAAAATTGDKVPTKTPTAAFSPHRGGEGASRQ